MLQHYCESLTGYKRLRTREVKIGHLSLGNFQPIRVQTMTTTDTMDTIATVEQTIRCIEAGAEMVRITAPSKKEAENLSEIKNELRKRGYDTPIVADIHFTPNAAEIAARIVEKVRVNPGNYIDKKRFDLIEYSDEEYAAEIDRIQERFTPLVSICKQYGTAMRIGTNHGSLSDRIMSRYGDTPMGMVESAMEFLRIARNESYHQIVLSMKSSNPLVMVQAYRLLVQKMDEEFGECYPLHLGVTEAGDGEDGRIKSAIGIGSLLEDGIGDTIRVSLTEDPELEIPVCQDIVRRYNPDRMNMEQSTSQHDEPIETNPDWHREKIVLPYNPFSYTRRQSKTLLHIGGNEVPVVVADFGSEARIVPESLRSIGYQYDEPSEKWTISDGAADFVYVGDGTIDFPLPGTLRVIRSYSAFRSNPDFGMPVLEAEEYLALPTPLQHPCFVRIEVDSRREILNQLIDRLKADELVIAVLRADEEHALTPIRLFLVRLMKEGVLCPVIIQANCNEATVDEQLVHVATDIGGLLLDGLGDGIWLSGSRFPQNVRTKGRTYLEVKNYYQFLNNTAFSILQATRTRISKTEYISCPSCGRTLFDLQETTAKIRAATHHLKGVKIAIMGCIVNGPGEMADADFGYVGSGPGRITLYKGKDIVKKNVPDDTAVTELIQLLRENDVWIEPANQQAAMA
jgi:(E)-4-hydroxy-3-methylbut-2-enyl-diphosphate synthase